MNKTKIEWCDSTWNPVTGCIHGCEYCYARKIADRFGSFETIDGNNIRVIDTGSTINCVEVKNRSKTPYPEKFTPTLHRYKLDDYKNKKGRNIFVCSMADLFGAWVPDEWIEQVFEACKAAPQHKYLFLTKSPHRYMTLASQGRLPADNNMWYGTSVPTPETEFFCADNYNTFISIEPIKERFPRMSEAEEVSKQWGMRYTDWIIIGAETGKQKNKTIPEREWIENLSQDLKSINKPVFMKDSVIPIIGEENMLREFPKELKNFDSGGTNSEKT